MLHKFQMFGKNIVLDVESGGIFVVNKLTYEMLDFIKIPMPKECENVLFEKFNKIPKNEVEECYDELFKLYSKGILFSKEINLENFKQFHQQSNIKSMCLHVAHDCNMRCVYCFASSGNFGGKKTLMNFNVARAAIDFLIKNSGVRKNLEVDFFGGEPLLNFEVIKQTVEYARKLEEKNNKNFRFTITTNGTLLNDAIIDYINNQMSNVVLSIDGTKKVNDAVRKMANSNLSSYDEAMPKFQQLVKKRKTSKFKNYYVRGTFTNKNLNFVDDVMHFYDCGFEQISVEPVVAPLCKSFCLKSNHLNEIFKQYEILAEKIIQMKQKKLKINFFHFMINLNKSPCLFKKIKGCGCGVEYVAVDPFGNVFPCHQFVGDEKFKMGSVFDGGLNSELKNLFSKANLVYKTKCKNCWAKYYCSGGCNANNFKYCNDLLTPYETTCLMTRKRIECAIAIKAALLKNN